MAGHSAKKTAKKAETHSAIYRSVGIAAVVFNLMIHFGYYRDFSVVSFVQSGFLTFVAWAAYRMILSALDMGLAPGLWQDLFIINTIVQVLEPIFFYAWMIYLVVPGYGVYKLGGTVLSWVFAGKSDAPPAEVRKPKRK
jgi:hypothetical protein